MFSGPSFNCSSKHTKGKELHIFVYLLFIPPPPKVVVVVNPEYIVLPAGSPSSERTHTQTPYKLQQTRRDKLDAGPGRVRRFDPDVRTLYYHHWRDHVNAGGGRALLPLHLLPTRWEEMKEKKI
jgi:hypothetical protein